MTPALHRPRTHLVAGRSPGSGPVLAILTDGHADPAVAAHAAGLAARTGTLLIAAAAVATGDGFSVNALLHRARDRRIDADTRAIVARVAPVLNTCGVAYMRTTLRLPDAAGAGRALPVHAVHQVVGRFGAVAVVAARPLHDPTGVLRPATESHAARPY